MTFTLRGDFRSGATEKQNKQVQQVKWPCTVGCLLDLAAGAMTVFVDGEPLEEQCEYTFPTDGREWAPAVALGTARDALFSCAM